MNDTPIHLIAEAGTNHNGSIATGKKLIRKAAHAGADSVKFQMIFPDGLYLPVEHLAGGATQPSAVFARRQATALNADGFRELAAYCREFRVAFSASVFDPKGIDLLVELDAPYIKIASCDLNNSPLIMRAAATGKRLVISTGMSDLEEIKRAIDDARRGGASDIVLMHCVSVYPCPASQANVAFLDTLAASFDVTLGYSDHTESSIAAAIAVSKSVTWIEKHVTLDRGSEGFDHAYAMEPAMFEAYVADVTAAYHASRPPAAKVCDAERDVRRRARRGLYAARRIEPGQTIRHDDVLIVRPESALAPNQISDLVGRASTRVIEQYQPLESGMVR